MSMSFEFLLDNGLDLKILSIYNGSSFKLIQSETPQTAELYPFTVFWPAKQPAIRSFFRLYNWLLGILD